MEKIDAAEKIEHSIATVEQIITTSGGSKRTLTMKMWSDEHGDISLMAYIAPARVKGDKILMRDGGDNIWYYMKRRDVTRHFARHAQRQSAMGSDFSYEDFSERSMTEDFMATVISEDRIRDTGCIKLNLVPKETGPSYRKMILWAGKEDNLSRKIEYYDEEGLLKILTFHDFKLVDNRKIAHRLEMRNVRENSETIMNYTSLSLRSKPDARLFTKEALSGEIQ